MADQQATMTLNAFGYREGDEWTALCMEMDLRGYGKTFAEALAELAEVVTMQLSFARFKGQPEQIRRPAQ